MTLIDHLNKHEFEGYAFPPSVGAFDLYGEVDDALVYVNDDHTPMTVLEIEKSDGAWRLEVWQGSLADASTQMTVHKPKTLDSANALLTALLETAAKYDGDSE